MSPKILLASKSPRRRELLTGLGLDVEVIASNAHTLGYFPGDEEVHENEAPADYVVRTALEKFREGLFLKEKLGYDAGLVVVAADTVVSLGSEILGKPADRAEAERFMRELSGRTHDVRTCVVVGTSGKDVRHLVSHSKVTFKTLTEEEVVRYAATDEPYDKAGGYGIQGRASLFISRIEGSFTGIMGLPLFETGSLLGSFGIELL